ncbi:MAG TPA: glycoside hydrolase family 16 protein [Bryobacteraceae bacterium]|jgi:beta-glucanase (GH16 family)|nr:glycoside hydrolase family 16 protein [Bryobacteraceae bacterium]
MTQKIWNSSRRSFLQLLCAASLAAQRRFPTRPAWSDEFNGAPGSAPDPSKWTYDLGNSGWGNEELETYTNSTANVFQDGQGHLVIRALKSGNGYTSGRIKTQGLYKFEYGRVEASIKIPYAQGIWPAFWMLGATIGSVGWPDCGEIDIMENFGLQAGDASTNHGTVHGPGYSGGAGITAKYVLPAGQVFSGAFHLFSLEWSPNTIKLLVDGNLYSTVTPASLPSGSPWVFNSSFFLLLNVAIGGLPTGSPNASTNFPQEMLVDYVRVYQGFAPWPRP